jgi:hypothetical protein
MYCFDVVVWVVMLCGLVGGFIMLDEHTACIFRADLLLASQISHPLWHKHLLLLNVMGYWLALLLHIRDIQDLILSPGFSFLY